MEGVNGFSDETYSFSGAPHLDDTEWGELQHGEGAGRQVCHQALGNGVEVGEQLCLVGSLLDEAVEGDEGGKGLQRGGGEGG